MKLHRDLGVTQKTAWIMLRRIRKAFDGGDEPPFSGPVEVDEAYFGGLRKNMSKARRKKLEGRGTVGKTAVVGAKDRTSNKVRVKVAPDTTGKTLQGFVRQHAEPGAIVYTDEATAYIGLGRDFDHEAVNHSVGEYVRGAADGLIPRLIGLPHGLYLRTIVDHLTEAVNEGDFLAIHIIPQSQLVESASGVTRKDSARSQRRACALHFVTGRNSRRRKGLEPSRRLSETTGPQSPFTVHVPHRLPDGRGNRTGCAVQTARADFTHRAPAAGRYRRAATVVHTLLHFIAITRLSRYGAQVVPPSTDCCLPRRMQSPASRRSFWRRLLLTRPLRRLAAGSAPP